MNNFDVTILTSQGDSRIKLIPTVSNVVLETSQSCPGFYKILILNYLMKALNNCAHGLIVTSKSVKKIKRTKS